MRLRRDDFLVLTERGSYMAEISGDALRYQWELPRRTYPIPEYESPNTTPKRPRPGISTPR